MTSISVGVAQEALYMFNIYRHPRDYPECFVVRRFQIGGGAPSSPYPDLEPWAVVDTLEHARDTLPDGLFNLGRVGGDEPHVVETWI